MDGGEAYLRSPLSWSLTGMIFFFNLQSSISSSFQQQTKKPIDNKNKINKYKGGEVENTNKGDQQRQMAKNGQNGHF